MPVGVASAGAPLRTAVFDPQLAAGADGVTELSRMKAAGASLVRISVHWSQIAPQTVTSGFDATNPEDPAYDWSLVDTEVQAAVGDGLQPILDVVDAPVWARVDKSAAVSSPRPAHLTAFSHAIAERYSGSFQGLPRVRYWQLWNEPNLNTYLQPQFAGTQPASPGIYRGMVNAFAHAVKGVSATNVVIVGGLAPYGIQRKGQPIDKVLSVAPQTFMRDLLCISAGAHPHATCRTKVAFDAFSVHPYTWGGPTHTAFSGDDVAIGDLPEVNQVLHAAWRFGHVQASSPPKLWVTEFSWDTNPPDPKAIPIGLQARWTAEALYHMWFDGVAVVTWFLLRDQPMSTPFQSGLYFAGPTLAADRPKPTLRAFRFPFVAYPRGAGIYVWGRTPSGGAATVLVQRRVGSTWRTSARLQVGAGGVFSRLLPLAEKTGFLRARLADGTDQSLPFSLKQVPDRRVSPFGS
jgi:hypothetical protein